MYMFKIWSCRDDATHVCFVCHYAEVKEKLIGVKILICILSKSKLKRSKKQDFFFFFFFFLTAAVTLKLQDPRVCGRCRITGSDTQHRHVIPIILMRRTCYTHPAATVGATSFSWSVCVTLLMRARD